MKERLNTTIQITTDTPSEIRLNVIMNPALSTSVYNYPLTMRSTIPASWTQVVVQQGSSVRTLTPVLEGNENVVYYNAVPNGGEVSLTTYYPPGNKYVDLYCNYYTNSHSSSIALITPDHLLSG